MTGAPRLVADERRVSDRRACSHLGSAPTSRGKSFSSTHLQSRVELLLVEAQAASQHSREATAHAIAAAQTLFTELRAARAACVAAERAAHLAAGAVSGVQS